MGISGNCCVGGGQGRRQSKAACKPQVDWNTEHRNTIWDAVLRFSLFLAGQRRLPITKLVVVYTHTPYLFDDRLHAARSSSILNIFENESICFNQLSVSMSMSMLIYVAHKRETSNALSALVRSEHTRFHMLPKCISANSRITQVVRQRIPHLRTSYRESLSGSGA